MYVMLYLSDQTRLGVWILDGDLRHRGLLKFALTEDTFTDRVVLLTATMTEPWSILESLNNWAEVLSTHIDRLKITPKKRRQYEENSKCVMMTSSSVCITMITQWNLPWYMYILVLASVLHLPCRSSHLQHSNLKNEFTRIFIFIASHRDLGVKYLFICSGPTFPRIYWTRREFSNSHFSTTAGCSQPAKSSRCKNRRR